MSKGMLIYKLTEIRLANLRNPLSFFKKNEYFQNDSQYKLSTKRIGSLFCIFFENVLRLFLVRLSHQIKK